VGSFSRCNETGYLEKSCNFFETQWVGNKALNKSKKKDLHAPVREHVEPTGSALYNNSLKSYDRLAG
jgi:hypothetical protein